MAYTPEEKKILAMYFTSTEDDVFALINLPEIVKGTLFSRYSRTAKDVRRLFLDEFFKEKQLSSVFKKTKQSEGNLVDLAKAEDFYERILVGYGDDSVAELGGAHVAIENLSMLATKSIEEHRVGLSPLEKSTRYVYFDRKGNGEYLFYKDEKIMKSKYKDMYIELNNLMFDTYSKIVREIQPLLKKIIPGDENDVAYKFSIRAKACDLARGLLPLSALTNMGVYGNGRAFEYLITTLLCDPLSEVREIGKQIHKHLSYVIPAFVERSVSGRGDACREYLTKTHAGILFKKKYVAHGSETLHTASVKLVDYDKKTIEKIITAILFAKTALPYKKAYQRVLHMSKKDKEAVLKAYLSRRKVRQHKPGRAMEEGYVGLEIVADWGVYKDLMRHRVLTRHRQLFTNELGYWIPKEIDYTGFGKLYRGTMDRAMEVYGKIKKDFPYEAQYVVAHAAYNRFYMRMNIREAIHMSELRSIPQGHPTYRHVAQEIAKEISKKIPLLGKYGFLFTDYKNYELERLSAFKRIQEKAKKMGVKVFEE